jgi:hypothetical protein
MFWFCAALSAAGVLESAICSCLVAELAGYWLLRRLLHSDKLPFLSRNHMVHHLLLYGPLPPMCGEKSNDAISKRGNVALESLAPLLVLPLNRKRLAIALQRYTLTISLDTLRSESTAEREAAFQ